MHLVLSLPQLEGVGNQQFRLRSLILDLQTLVRHEGLGVTLCLHRGKERRKPDMPPEIDSNIARMASRHSAEREMTARERAKDQKASGGTAKKPSHDQEVDATSCPSNEGSCASSTVRKRVMQQLLINARRSRHQSLPAHVVSASGGENLTSGLENIDPATLQQELEAIVDQKLWKSALFPKQRRRRQQRQQQS